MEKKDSIFSGLSPVPSQAPRPGVPDQEVAALKQKLDAMERNILAQLEKKIAEARVVQAPQPPPPPKPPDLNAQFLLARIGELEKKLEEFARGAALSPGQLKNIEESKAGARREIEDLLKVVREQQKYSEMDRAMHDQVEKSWRRVEDLEKKLMDFYMSAVNRNAGEREPGRADLSAGEVGKIVAAEMRKFMDELAGRNGEKNSALGLSLDSRLAAFEMEFRNFYLNISKTVIGYADELTKQAGRDEARLKKMENDAESSARTVRSDMAAVAGRLEERFRESSEEIAARIKAENAKNTEKIMEFSGLSAYTLAEAADLERNMEKLESRLVKLRSSLRSFVDGMRGVDLNSVSGVSGEIARKSFESLKNSLKEMEIELADFNRQKAVITGNLGGISRKNGT